MIYDFRDAIITSPTAIARHLARLDPRNGLYGSNENERTQVKTFCREILFIAATNKKP